MRFLIEKIIEDCSPDLILSVGTSGGVDPEDRLGDVIVSNSALFILGEEFADASFNRMKYISQWTPRDTYRNIIETPQNMPLISGAPVY